MKRTPNDGYDGTYEGMKVFKDCRVVEHVEGTLKSEDAVGLGRVEKRLMVDGGRADVVVVGQELVEESSGLDMMADAFGEVAEFIVNGLAVGVLNYEGMVEFGEPRTSDGGNIV